MYCEPDNGYYELTEVEEIFSEYLPKMKNALLKTVKDEVEQLRKENQEIKERNSKLIKQVNEIEKFYRLIEI